jgi:hypothetical protein
LLGGFEAKFRGEDEESTSLRRGLVREASLVLERCLERDASLVLERCFSLRRGEHLSKAMIASLCSLKTREASLSYHLSKARIASLCSLKHRDALAYSKAS